MPTPLDSVIYGSDEKTDFTKFDIGKVMKAIADDLEEFGKKGVQGVKVAPNWKNFVEYHKARTDLKSPYLQAGTVKGTLVLVLRDKKDPKLEAMDVLVKDYVKLKQKLASSTASVTNISPHDDSIINNSVRDTGAKLGVAPSDDPAYGEITGNIVLTAHGTPSVAPSGRVIGSALGRRTPEDIVAMLTTDRDPKKRVAKTFNGQLTLCGCFTASGGPEGEKQDDPFAKKVLDLFRRKGYTKISVVGYPGATITDSGPNTDSRGTSTSQGDERVLASQPTGATRERAKQLTTAAKNALETMNGAVEPYNVALRDRNQKREAARLAHSNSGQSRQDFFRTTAGKKLAAALKKAEEELTARDTDYEQAKARYEKAKQDLTDSGLNDTIGHLEGRFGLREIN